MVRTRCDARTAQFCGGNTTFLALGARPAQLERECRRGEAPGRCASGSGRFGDCEGGDKRRGGLCVRGGTKGLSLARRHKLCDGHIPRCTKDKKKYTDRGVRTHAFEKTST